MNTPRYAAAAARVLRQYLPAASLVSGDEARGLATIERALRARARRRRLVVFGSVLAAAAAVWVVVTQLGKAHQPVAAATIAIDVSPSGQGASLSRNAVEEQLKARMPLESGQRIDTPAKGGASLWLSTGTSMVLAGQTSFRVDSQGATQRFSLHQGELSAHVAKLTAAQRFVVDTPDAEVEVRGTRFRLRVVERGELCGAGTRTRLEVTEGVVEVRTANLGTASVKAGGSWPLDCTDKAEPPPHANPAPEIAKHASAERKHQAHAAPLAAADGLSALAAPNDLFAEGVARSRQGDTGGALRIYQELVARFPASPLAENAMVERMRLLAKTSDGRAEAARYLARYPRGFAVAEAQKVVAAP